MAEEQLPQPFFVVRQPTAAAVPPEQLYSLIGENGIARLTAAFYEQIPGDDILAPMYPEDDLQASESRLRDFLVFRFGGPQRYIDQRGHPRLRMRHAPFPIDQRARDRWLACMDKALHQMDFPDHASTALRAFFQEVATFLINRATPPQSA